VEGRAGRQGRANKEVGDDKESIWVGKGRDKYGVLIEGEGEEVRVEGEEKAFEREQVRE